MSTTGIRAAVDLMPVQDYPAREVILANDQLIASLESWLRWWHSCI